MSQVRELRLRKQWNSLQKQPMQYAFVQRSGDLNFYFCLYNLTDDFTNGFYFGLLQLHENYPFYPPKLFFYTPNGRYQVNTAICTSFTNYHPQNWTAAWNVRSLIQATISFMYSNQASYGCIQQTSITKKKLAQKSLSQNLNNTKFYELFYQTIEQNLLKIHQKGIKIFDHKIQALLQLKLKKQYQSVPSYTKQIKIFKQNKQNIQQQKKRNKEKDLKQYQKSNKNQILIGSAIGFVVVIIIIAELFSYFKPNANQK